MSGSPSLNDLITQLLTGLQKLDTLKGVEKSNDTIKKTDDIAKKTTKSLDHLLNSYQKFTSYATKEQKSLDDMASGLEDIGKAIEDSIILKFATAIPFVGNVIGAFRTMAVELSKTLKVFNKFVNHLDSISSPLRQIQREAFDIGKAFGKSFEESSKFADGLLEFASSGALQDTFISFPELLKMADGFKKAGLSIEYMTEAVQLGDKNLNLLAATNLIAGATGLGLEDTTRTLTKSIMEQGLSIEQATGQYGLFKDSAEKTGLTISDVKSGLEGAVDNFKNLGVAAEFAKPVLDTFATSLGKAGLGIKQAKGLTQELTSSILGMANSYEKAFITMSRGGMDFSGGVFGASIEMQGKILDAEKTGDQSALARETVGAMKKSLESFTGGQIVTVNEARESPELQKTFVMQQKLLQDMYGMNQTSATRTLEMMKELEGAKAVGDDEAAAKLDEMIKEEMDGRDATLDVQEKIAKNTANNVMATLMLNKSFRGLSKASRLGAERIGGWGEAAIESVAQKGMTSMEGFIGDGSGIDKYAEQFRTEPGDEDLSSMEIITREMLDKSEDLFVAGGDLYEQAKTALTEGATAFKDIVVGAANDFAKAMPSIPASIELGSNTSASLHKNTPLGSENGISGQIS